MEVRQLNPFGHSTRKAEMLGKLLVEAIEKKADDPMLPRAMRERYSGYFEALTAKKEVLADDASLYSTVVSSFIEEAYQPKMTDVVKKIDFPLNSGASAIKIPKDGNMTAQAITATGTFGSGEDTTAYGDATITVAWNGCYTSVPYPLMTWSNVDLLAHRLGQIGKAIGNKVDDDCLTQLEKAGTKDDATYGDNSNYSYLGATTNLSWDGIAGGIAVAEGLNMTPDTIIVTPSNLGVILKDDDLNVALKYASVINQAGAIVPMPATLFNMKLLVSSQLTAKNTLLVDSGGCGYLAEGSGIQTWDGRVDNTLQFQVVGAKAYGCTVVRPTSVVNVIDNTVEPT